MEMLDTVALLEDVTSEGLLRGQVGTIVMVYDADHFEVKFVDPEGHTYGLTMLQTGQLVSLVHTAAPAA